MPAFAQRGKSHRVPFSRLHSLSDVSLFWVPFTVWSTIRREREDGRAWTVRCVEIGHALRSGAHAHLKPVAVGLSGSHGGKEKPMWGVCNQVPRHSLGSLCVGKREEESQECGLVSLGVCFFRVDPQMKIHFT